MNVKLIIMFLESFRYKRVPDQSAPYRTETNGLGEAKH